MANINWSLSPSIAIAQKQPNSFDDDIRRIGAMLQALGNERRLKEEQAEQKKIDEERWKKAFELQERMYNSIPQAMSAQEPDLTNLNPEERYWLEEANRYNALGIQPREGWIAPGYQLKIGQSRRQYWNDYLNDLFSKYGVK